jgi:hypothetical protein
MSPKTIIGGAIVIGYPVLMNIAPLAGLPHSGRIAGWSIYAALIIAYALYEIRSRWRRSMTLPLFLVIAGGLGVCAGAILWYAVPVRSLPEEALNFYFRAGELSSGLADIQYGNVTLTNRSDRDMSLTFSGDVYFTDKRNTTRRLTLEAEWNPQDMQEGTGNLLIDVPKEKTHRGKLAIFLPKPQEFDLDGWEIDLESDVIIGVFDSVTGKRAYFKDSYPDGLVDSSLPGVEWHQMIRSMTITTSPVPGQDSGPITADVTATVEPENAELAEKTRLIGEIRRELIKKCDAIPSEVNYTPGFGNDWMASVRILVDRSVPKRKDDLHLGPFGPDWSEFKRNVEEVRGFALSLRPSDIDD